MNKSEKTFMDAVISKTISGKIIWNQPDKDKMRFVSKSEQYDFLLDVHIDIGKSLSLNILLNGQKITLESSIGYMDVNHDRDLYVSLNTLELTIKEVVNETVDPERTKLLKTLTTLLSN